METRSQQRKRLKQSSLRQESPLQLRPSIIHGALHSVLNSDVIGVIQEYARTCYALYHNCQTVQFWNLDTFDLECKVNLDQFSERHAWAVKKMFVVGHTLLRPIYRYSPTTKTVRFWSMNLDTFQVVPPTGYNAHKLSTKRQEYDLMNLEVEVGSPSSWLTYCRTLADVITCYCLATKQSKRFYRLPNENILWYGVSDNHLTRLLATTATRLEVQEVNLLVCDPETPAFVTICVIDISPPDASTAVASVIPGGALRLPIRPGLPLCTLNSKRRLYLFSMLYDNSGAGHWIIDMNDPPSFVELKFPPNTPYDGMTAWSDWLQGGNTMIFKCYYNQRSIFEDVIMDAWVVNLRDMHHPIWRQLNSEQHLYEQSVGEYVG